MGWRLATKPDGGTTKVPINVITGAKASATAPETWASFARTLESCNRGQVDGIGFVFTREDPYIGVDVDKCRDAETGIITPWAWAIIERFQTYSETSPSGTGIHIIGKGTLPPGRRRTGHIETYDRDRYFTVTGDVIPGFERIADGGDTLTTWYAETFPAQAATATQPPPVPVHLDDDAIIERARSAANGAKFETLWRGDTGGHGDDDSAADLALLSLLSFWSQDPVQLDRLFRRSGLFREKWGRQDYRERTLERALDRGAFYDPGTQNARGNDSRDCDAPAGPPLAPPFPEGIFPAAIDAYVNAGARSIGVPVEMIAVPLLVAAGSTIGNAVEIVLKRGYKQFSTLWAGIVAPPGTAKSPSFQVAQWPLHRLQHDAYELWQRARAEYEADLDRWSAKPKAERGSKPEAPILEHVYSTDPTLEALVAMVNGCRGVAILRDELSGMIGSFDKYRGGKGSDLQEYLQLWAGAPIKADRKGGGSVYAVHPVAGICGGIQPDILRRMHDDSGRRNGFIERFLLCVPDVEPSGWTDDDLDPDLLPPVVETFRRLRTFSKTDDAERISVHLSIEARRVWVAWYDANAHAIKHVAGLQSGFYAKLPNQVARIALTLHCLRNDQDPRPMVAETTMLNAIAVGEFFREHLNRVLPLIGESSHGAPVGLAGRITRILRKPRADNRDGWVRRTTIYDELRNVSSDALTSELTHLLGLDQVETRTVATPTKPAEEWREKTQPSAGFSGYSGNPHGLGPESTPEGEKTRIPRTNPRVVIETEDSDSPHGQVTNGASDDTFSQGSLSPHGQVTGRPLTLADLDAEERVDVEDIVAELRQGGPAVIAQWRADVEGNLALTDRDRVLATMALELATGEAPNSEPLGGTKWEPGLLEPTGTAGDDRWTR